MRFIVLLLLPLAALAQSWSGLATNFDGSVVYFSSTARQAGTQQTFHSKIYRWDATNGVQVAAEQPDEGQSIGCFTTSTFFNLTAPQVGLDGTLLGYTASRPNPGPNRFCNPDEPNQATILPAKTFPGLLALSANARYAVTSPLNADTSGYHAVTDLNTGLATLVEGPFNGAAQQVTDSGAVLTAHDYAAALTLPNGQSRVTLTQRLIQTAVIDRVGKTLFYSSSLGPSTSAYVAAVDAASGRETQIDSGFSFRALSVTADGRLFYASATGLQIAMPGSALPRMVAHGNFSSAVVSGDGRVAYGLSDNLVRVDVPTGSTTPIASVPRSAALYLVSGNPVTDVAAGSILTNLDSTQSVSSICGKTPLQRPNQVAIQVQIPFDQPEGACTVVLASGGFETATILQIHSLFPQFILGGLIDHANFQRVSEVSPARPGEALVAFMTGLGPVDSSGLLQNQLACSFDDQSADILYSGSAPGYPGIYQVNLRVPNLSDKAASLTCRFPAAPGYYAQANVAVISAP